jgi:hypothetical protein
MEIICPRLCYIIRFLEGMQYSTNIVITSLLVGLEIHFPIDKEKIELKTYHIQIVRGESLVLR